MPDAQFLSLLRLIIARFEDDDGLVSRDESESEDSVSDEDGRLKVDLTHQGITRLRAIIRQSVPSAGDKGLVDAPRKRGARLAASREQISWNGKELADHPDEIVRELTR